VIAALEGDVKSLREQEAEQGKKLFERAEARDKLVTTLHDVGAQLQAAEQSYEEVTAQLQEMESRSKTATVQLRTSSFIRHLHVYAKAQCTCFFLAWRERVVAAMTIREVARNEDLSAKLEASETTARATQREWTEKEQKWAEQEVLDAATDPTVLRDAEIGALQQQLQQSAVTVQECMSHLNDIMAQTETKEAGIKHEAQGAIEHLQAQLGLSQREVAELYGERATLQDEMQMLYGELVAERAKGQNQLPAQSSPKEATIHPGVDDQDALFAATVEKNMLKYYFFNVSGQSP